MSQFSGLEKVILGWDLATWRHALELWESYLPSSLTGLKALEIGAHQGGLSLYLALKGAEVICSDLNNPESLAGPLHRRYTSQIIQYRSLDVRHLDLPAASVDIVICKSVLGGVRKRVLIDPKPGIMAEIYRVLRPGAYLLIAENIQGQWWHQWLRRHFVVWSRGWEYLPYDAWLALWQDFECLDWCTAGYTALLGRNEAQRRGLARVDQVLKPYLSSHAHYMLAAVLRKPFEGESK